MRNEGRLGSCVYQCDVVFCFFSSARAAVQLHAANGSSVLSEIKTTESVGGGGM